MPKLLIVVNEDRFFLSHRMEVGMAACRNGYEVYVAAKDLGNFQKIRDLGITPIDMPINPAGMNPLEELKTLRFLMSLVRKIKPDIIHNVGLKNILWGGIVARVTKVPCLVNAVCGLGGLFSSGKLTTLNNIILRFIRFGNHRKGVKVIFQNYDDMSLFMSAKAVSKNQVEYIKGSGVDLEEFPYMEEMDTDIISIIFTARLVKEKGVYELIEAAKLLEPEMRGKVRFLICGRYTDNSSAVSREYMEANTDSSYINYLGERDDISVLLSSSHIMAFPSYYREGVPKSLIEACAVGRPIVTCNSVGCRDAVDDGVNGFLVEPRNAVMLAEKLRQLINDRGLRIRMGRASRCKAEREFDLSEVVRRHISIYNKLMADANSDR